MGVHFTENDLGKIKQGWSEYSLIKAIHFILYVSSALLFGFGEDILIQTLFLILISLILCVTGYFCPNKDFLSRRDINFNLCSTMTPTHGSHRNSMSA